MDSLTSLPLVRGADGTLSLLMLAAPSFRINIRVGGIALHTSNPDDADSRTPAVRLHNGSSFLCGGTLTCTDPSPTLIGCRELRRAPSFAAVLTSKVPPSTSIPHPSCAPGSRIRRLDFLTCSESCDSVFKRSYVLWPTSHHGSRGSRSKHHKISASDPPTSMQCLQVMQECVSGTSTPEQRVIRGMF